MRLLAFTLAAAFICGCSHNQEDPIKTAVSEKIKSSLKDPESAKIVVSEIFPLFDGRVACGTVNAKNSFGGYTGPMNFQATVLPSGTIGDVDISSDEKRSAMSAESCLFLKEFGKRPGHSGSPATALQQAELLKEFQIWSQRTAARIQSASQ